MIALTAALLVATTYAHAGQTTRVSSAVSQGNSYSWHPLISANGRYVVFNSNADNLVAGDTNGYDDVYVRDRLAGKTSCISVSSAGVQGNQGSDIGSISADGRYVTFTSYADNLVADDTNASDDVFVRDRVTGKTTRVSVSSTRAQGNNLGSFEAVISADGRYVAFRSFSDNLVTGDTNGEIDIFVRDRVTGTTKLVGVSSAGVQGNGYGSSEPTISADGRYVAFSSDADNLVAGDTNDTYDVFVRDRLLNSKSVADLQATVTAKPASAKKGQTASYRLTVKNNGPNSAGNGALTDIISNGTVLSITPSQGTCSQAAISVCRLNTLAAGARATVAVTIRAEACSLTQQLSVSATPKDNAPSNNALRISTPVIIPPDLLEASAKSMLGQVLHLPLG